MCIFVVFRSNGIAGPKRPLIIAEAHQLLCMLNRVSQFAKINQISLSKKSVIAIYEQIHFPNFPSFPASSFSKFIKKNVSDALLYYFILKVFYSPNWINGCNHCGPNATLDTKIVKIDLYHILMSYTLFDVICVI